jgi:hypothetical protein
MPKTPFDLIAFFPYARTRGRCRIRGIEFRDIDDLDGLEQPVRSHAQTLGGMFYTCQGGRIAKPMFAAIAIPDGKSLAVAHRALIEAQLLITYIYGAPHSSPTATDDIFLSSECSTLFTFTPDRIVSSLARLTKSDAESGRIAAGDAESLPSSDFIEGYEGLRNQVVPLWVAEGSRIYPELPNICLNYSQYLDAHLEQFLSAAKNWPFRYVFGRNDLSHDNQERVFSSLLWYSRSCRTSADPTERLLILAIALETLLALAKGERLTERFKEAVVTLVGPVPRLDEWLSQFYAARSTTVHKGSPGQLFFKTNPVHATLPHRALIVYGRRVFRICMTAVLTGALLTEESQIASLLIHNNERLDEICKLLATADKSALDRLLAVEQQVEELHECETITLLRLEENLDKLYGAARLLLKTYSDCKQVQNSEIDSALSAVVLSDRSTKARDVHDQLHKLMELLRHAVRVERKGSRQDEIALRFLEFAARPVVGLEGYLRDEILDGQPPPAN